MAGMIDGRYAPLLPCRQRGGSPPSAAAWRRLRECTNADVRGPTGPRAYSPNMDTRRIVRRWHLRFAQSAEDDDAWRTARVSDMGGGGHLRGDRSSSELELEARPVSCCGPCTRTRNGRSARSGKEAHVTARKCTLTERKCTHWEQGWGFAGAPPARPSGEEVNAAKR